MIFRGSLVLRKQGTFGPGRRGLYQANANFELALEESLGIVAKQDLLEAESTRRSSTVPPPAQGGKTPSHAVPITPVRRVSTDYVCRIAFRCVCFDLATADS
jgi:hypothetical protein